MLARFSASLFTDTWGAVDLFAADPRRRILRPSACAASVDGGVALLLRLTGALIDRAIINRTPQDQVWKSDSFGAARCWSGWSRAN